jgi:hypothetical protein
MTVHHKDLCPCGSGKRYKHCHLPIHKAQRQRAMFAGAAVVVLAAGGAVAWTASQNRGPSAVGAAGGGGTSDAGSNAFGGIQPGVAGRSPTPAQQGQNVSVGGASGNALQPGENPKPWEYDVAKNRHYDPSPGHRHWHDGPPPANPGAPSTATTTAPLGGVSATTASGAPVKITGTSTVQVAPSTALAPGENPKPYEYDAVKNRYFDPAHNHWHDGKPPANAGATGSGTTTP